MKSLFALVVAAFSAASYADPIVIGQTADFSSVAGSQMVSFNAGAQAYFNEVNRKGGIAGRPIKLVSMDDGFSADRARQNAQKLISDKSVMMLFGPRGTDPSEAVVAEAERSELAVVAPITGADSVRSSPVVFPVRTSYRQEVSEMLKHASIASNKIAVLVQDDKFGKPLYDFIKSEIKSTYPGVKITGEVLFDRKNVDMKAEAEKILSLGTYSVIALCNPSSCGAFMKHIHDISMDKRLPKPVVYQTSISDMFVQFEKLGKNVVAGSPYSQVIPNPHNDTYGVSREFMALMKKVAGPIDYRSFEGYISAKVAVQGLMKSKAISRSEIRSTLEHLGSFDLGGFSVTYYPGSRIGSSFAELVSVNSTGKMIH